MENLRQAKIIYDRKKRLDRIVSITSRFKEGETMLVFGDNPWKIQKEISPAIKPTMVIEMPKDGMPRLTFDNGKDLFILPFDHDLSWYQSTRIVYLDCNKEDTPKQLWSKIDNLIGKTYWKDAESEPENIVIGGVARVNLHPVKEVDENGLPI